MKYCGMVTLYNPTNENIEKILRYVDYIPKIYIVDNGSVDLAFRFQKFNNIIYIFNGENLGIATALNIAAKMAIKDGYQWLLTMDQDSFISKDNVNYILDYINNNDTTSVGIISPYHNVETHQKKSNNDVEECLEVMTSGNFLNLNIYKKIGGFKDWLFIDDVDIEYCLNLNKNGYKVLRLNNVIMEHHLGDTKVYKLFKKKFIVSNHNAIRRYYMVRNMNYIYDMYYDVFPDYCKFLKKIQKGQVRYIILFENNKFKKLLNMYRGYKDYKNGIKGKISY